MRNKSLDGNPFGFMLVLRLFIFMTVLVIATTSSSSSSGGNNNENDGENNKQKRKPPPPNFDFNGGFGGGPGGGTVCPNYRCSGGTTPVPKSTRMKFTSTGCSAMSSSITVAGMGTQQEEIYESCCDQWHACYQVCGTSKQSCDESFKTCANGMCAGDERCTRQVDISALMINMGGCDKFNQAQYESCDCIDKKIVEEKREASIRRFYKKYGPPGSESKAKELVKKANTISKLAGLIRKLLGKYPHAIQKVEDPQQAAYRRIMEEVKNKEETTQDEEDNTGQKEQEQEEEGEEEVQEL